MEEKKKRTTAKDRKTADQVKRANKATKAIEANKEIKVNNDLGNDWKSLTEKVANFSNIIMGFQSVMQMFDAGVGKLKDLAADAAALDDVYADVQKTTAYDSLRNLYLQKKDFFLIFALYY